MIHFTTLCVITLLPIASIFTSPVATSPHHHDSTVTEYTTEDVEYEDESADVQVTTKSGLIRCNMSNSIVQIHGYSVHMSFLDELEAETTAREYIAKYKLSK